jgi:hypothetical protein
LEAARAAMTHLERLAARENLPPPTVAFLRATIRQRTRLDLDEIAHAGEHDNRTAADVLRRVEHEMRGAARRAVVALRDRNVIGQEAMRRVQLDLDLDEVRSDDELQ